MNFQEFCKQHNLRSDPSQGITVRQPWAYLLAAGFKTIENRSWSIPKTIAPMEPVAIHAASKYDDSDETLVYLESIWKRCPMAFDALEHLTGVGDRDAETAALDMMVQSAIIGVCWFSHSVKVDPSGFLESVRPGETQLPDDFFDRPCGSGPSPEVKHRTWLTAETHAWVAAKAVRFVEPIHTKGKLRFFQLPDWIDFSEYEIAEEPSLCHSP